MIFAKTMSLLHLALLTIGARRKIPNKLGTSLYRFRKYTETFSNGGLKRIIIITPCEQWASLLSDWEWRPWRRGLQETSFVFPRSGLAPFFSFYVFSYFLAPLLCFSSFSRNFFLIFSVRRQSMGSRSGKHEVMSWYFIANCWWIRWWSDFMWKLYCWWLMIFDRVLSMIYNYPSKQFEGDLETSRERKQIS